MIRYNDKHMQKTFSTACKCEIISCVRICCSLVYKNTIIYTRGNSRKSHPFQKRYAYRDDAIYLHAETHTIATALRMGFDFELLKHCQLYVARASKLIDRKNFNYADSKPCVGCQSAIAAHGIKHVFYTNNSGEVSCL